MATSKTVEKKLVKLKSGLKIVSTNKASDSLILLEEPQWKSDDKCLQCASCLRKFDMFRRRHHCRRCGNCFCDDCCGDLVPLPRMCFVDPVRHCSDCASVSLKENEFFTNQLKLLLNGAALHVSYSLTPTADANLNQYIVRLSTDHRSLVLNSLGANVKPVDVVSLSAVNSFTPTEQSGDMLCVVITYHDNDQASSHNLSLYTIQSSSQKVQGSRWLNALIKALRMILENKETNERQC